MPSAASPQQIQMQRAIASWEHPAKGTVTPGTLEVVAAAGHRVIVVDDEPQRVMLLDLAGRVLDSTDAHPQLVQPVSVAFQGPNEVLVLNGHPPRLLRYVLRDGKLVFAAATPLRGVPGVWSLCSLANKAVILGGNTSGDTGGLLQVVSRDGEMRSVGEPFGSTKFERVFYGAGRLLCLSPERSVIAASRFMPEVRSYGESGVLRWRSQLRDFLGVRLIEVGRGQMRYGYRPDSLWDQVSAVFAPAAGMIAVQITRRYGTGSGERTVRVQTQVFSAKDGRFLNAQNDLPIVRAATADRLLVQDPSAKSIIAVHGFAIRR